VLPVLIATLAHDVPEQHCALGGVDRVLHRRAEEAERLRCLPLLCRRLIAAH